MSVSPVAYAQLTLSPSIVRPSTRANRSPHSNIVHTCPTSRCSRKRNFLPVFLALVVFPTLISAAPPTHRLAVEALHRRQGSGSQSGSNNNSPGNGGINMTVWLPILLVVLVFALFSFVTCVRRCAASNSAASATADRTGTTPASGVTTRPRRRPRRTPSQISTKSLPVYMKEPGDHELVLFRGPSDMEDEMEPPQPMPTLTEDDNEHPEMRGATFDVPLDRVDTVDSMPDSSTTNLIRAASASVPRPPELHHADMPSDHRRSRDARSLDSIGSEVELLAGNQRGASIGHGADPRGEAPAYTEAVSVEGGMTIVSLNDPEPNNDSTNTVAQPAVAAGRRRSRFSFLAHNPFSLHNQDHPNQSPSSTRSESPVVQSGSSLSRFSTRDSHESHHSRTPSRNNISSSHTRSNSNLFRALHSHSPGLPAGSSISLDSISAPLTHTAKRAEFHAPKGGLLTPEQVKLITSREALERFGVPYGPDAVAAFSLSRERLAETGPPPDFESVAGQQEETGASGSGSTTEAAVPRSETVDEDTTLTHSASHRTVEPRAVVMSHGDASQVQIVQTYESDNEGEGEVDGASDEPGTARPMTPRTTRPLSLSGDH